MRKTTIWCDGCGRDVTKLKRGISIITMAHAKGKDYDLCGKCAKEYELLGELYPKKDWGALVEMIALNHNNSKE